MLYTIKQGYLFWLRYTDSIPTHCKILDANSLSKILPQWRSYVDFTTPRVFIFFEEQNSIFHEGVFWTLDKEYHEFIERLV